MITVVTCFFDLQRREGSTRRDAEFYLEHGRKLCGFNVPMVIFADPEYAPRIREMREAAGHNDRTLVVPFLFEQLPHHARTQQIIENRKMNPIPMLNPLKDTAQYQILIWAKPWLVRQAIDLDPFAATHYVWHDFALHHVATTNHVVEDDVYTDEPRKIRYMEIRVMDPRLMTDWKEYFRQFHWYCAGAMFRGPRERMVWFYEQFDLVLNEILDAGFAPLDQEITPVLVHRFPDRFESYCGDYRSIMENYRFAREDSWLLALYAREATLFGQREKLCRLGKTVLDSQRAGVFGGNRDELSEILNLWYVEASPEERKKISDFRSEIPAQTGHPENRI
jgi:hypothetical protein